MKGLEEFPDNYFQKFKETPVKLKPYSQEQESVANIYIEKVRRFLADPNTELMIRGSTAFKIMGKCEVEIGVYPGEKHWEDTISHLTTLFGQPENQEKDYVRFNNMHNNREIEIIMLKGHEAEVDIKLHEYLQQHPELLKEYEEIKKKYAFSKREYQKQKNAFLTKVIDQIPE